MARPSNILESKDLHVMIPEDIYARMKLHLWSDVQSRVPLGAYQRFIVERIREFFTPSQCTCDKPCPIHNGEPK